MSGKASPNLNLKHSRSYCLPGDVVKTQILVAQVPMLLWLQSVLSDQGTAFNFIDILTHYFLLFDSCNHISGHTIHRLLFLSLLVGKYKQIKICFCALLESIFSAAEISPKSPTASAHPPCPRPAHPQLPLGTLMPELSF